MEDKVDFKMYFSLFILFIAFNASFSQEIIDRDNKCDCNGLCEKNFTTNSIKDVQKISACQRGCRFHSLILHTCHESDSSKAFLKANEGCFSSCSESYKTSDEISACNFGCNGTGSSKLCETVENQIPQISYSFVIEESDVLIHPGEPEPDDSLTDPGLRKQFQKTLVALFDSRPKIPEIRFRNLPLKIDKHQEEIGRTTFKCPKFYGFDVKFEYRNAKIVIGDLYMFLGIFLIVVGCFFVGHKVESKKNLKNQVEPKKNLKPQVEPKNNLKNQAEPQKNLKNQAELQKNLKENVNPPTKNIQEKSCTDADHLSFCIMGIVRQSLDEALPSEIVEKCHHCLDDFLLEDFVNESDKKCNVKK